MLKHNLLKTFEFPRSQEIELSKRYPLDLVALKRLATIDNSISNCYAIDGKRDDAWSFMEESIGYCEACLALSPGDVEIQKLQIGSACFMLNECDNENDRLYEQWNPRAIAMLERSKLPYDVHVIEMSQLSYYHRLHASFLMLRGEPDRARKELEDDLRLVRSVPVAETAFPEFALSEAATLAALGQWSGEFTPLRSPTDRQPPIVDINQFEKCLAELAARRIGWLPSVARSPWLIPMDLPTKGWTDRVISSIQSDATKFHIDPTRIPAIGWNMMHPCASTQTWYRKVDKLGEAHRLADQEVALAERLTRSYLYQASAYMLLSEGYVQESKNACRDEGAPLAPQWDQKALDAALHAEKIEPDNDEARGLVKNRRARLKKATSK